MNNKRRKTTARVAVAAIGIILALIVAALIPGSADKWEVLDLEVIPARQTVTGTVPAEYWAWYRITHEDDSTEYVWHKITREQFAELKAEGA